MFTGSAGQQVEVDGVRVAYHREGRGEPVLLVHGITTHSFIWRQLLPHLARDYDVLAVDLPGCGASSMEPGLDLSLPGHARTLIGLLDRLDLPRVHLVGHDVGGGICQLLAVHHPTRLRDLALLNTVAYDFWPVQPIIAMRTPILRLFAMATLDLGALRLIVRRGLHHPQRLTPELLALFWGPMQTRAGRKAFLRFAASLDNAHLLAITDDLRRLDLPTLVVRGDSDVYLSAAIAERLAAEIPGAALVRIPTAGHFLQEDEPSLLARLLLDHFRRATDVRPP